jgi:hypothetical protein
MSFDRDPPRSEQPVSAGTDEPLVRPADEAEPAPATDHEVTEGVTPSGAAEPAAGRHDPSRNMLPGRERRRSGVERLLVRLIATCGIVGIGVAIAAIMVSNKSQGWVVGLVVSIVSVVLAAVLWSSRQL